MSKKLGFSIRYQGDEMIAVGISSLEKSRWRVDHLEINQANVGPSTPLAKAMNKSSATFSMIASGDEINTSLVALPKLKKKQLGLAATGWVAREESTPADQWNVVWQEREHSNGNTKPDQTDVFLLYAPKKYIAAQIAQANNWNGAPSRLVPDFLVLESMFRKYGPGSDELAGWNVVFVSKEDHFLCVSTPSGLIMNRPLPADLSEGSDGGEYLDRLATEVDRSIFFARQTEFNPNVERIIVCGDTILAQGLVARLKEETSVPAVFWDIADMFESAGAKLDAKLMLPVMAAVMARNKCQCNLLPRKSRTLLGPVLQRRLVVAGTTAAAVVIPLLAVGGFLTSNIQDRYLDRARLQLQQAQVRADEAAQIYIAQRVLKAREEHIATINQNDQDFAQVLLHLAALTPGEIIFKDLRLREAGDGQLVLLLTGESISNTVEVAQQSFLDFQGALNSSQLLKSTGEPRKLIIAAENDQGVLVKKVEFSMEYQVKSFPATQQEVAILAAHGEG